LDSKKNPDRKKSRLVFEKTRTSLRGRPSILWGGLICNGQDFGGHGGGPVPAKILPATIQTPHKIEGMPRRLNPDLTNSLKTRTPNRKNQIRNKDSVYENGKIFAKV
jgi:hypothetical protein